MWNIRISWGQKLALMGLFSLTIIATIVSILRVALVSSTKHQIDTTWLYTWSNIDMAVAIMVACLASFRELFVKSESAGLNRKSQNPHLGDGSLLSCFQSLKLTTMSGRSGLSSQGSDMERVFTSPRNSTTSKIPIDAIYVRTDVNISLDDEERDM
ncbi:MAG: hypothetical protein ASARMPRED_003408 [Alectoria sarmentosa]|nr:MAG: hypothetical protein ASARMPRED_003408 [Alectoria sarmentosa]